MNAATEAKLERRCRRLTRLYPQRWRALYEEDLVATLLDGVGLGDRRLKTRVQIDLIVSALGIRIAGRRIVLRATLVLVSLLVITVLGLTGRVVSPEFLVTSLVVAAIPGTGVFFTVSSAISGGRSRGIVAAFGCTLGIVPHIVAAALGLSGIMQIGATFFEVVRWAGVAYLIFMGLTLLKDGGDLLVADQLSGKSAGPSSTPVVIRRGVLLNLLNPKLTLFFFAFLPPFLDRSSRLLNPQMLVLSAVFMAATFAVFSVYALASAALRDQLLAAPRARLWFQRTLGSLLIGFGIRLAVAKR
jgi:threonine/homoserine/homoserine lactone efflux protein